MPFREKGTEGEPLRVVWMAAALVTAAILGAVLGFVWQSAGFGEGEAEQAQTDEG